jgi:hypothetical protein
VKQGGQHPIAAGVTALVAVAVGVGLIIGIGMFVGANILGLGGGGAADDQATDPDAGASLYAPSPKPTKTANGPAITLDSSPTSAPEKQAATTSPSPSKTVEEKPAEKEITLQAGIVQAKPMERIDLSGIYPRGEGAILRLERNDGQGWEEFGIPDVRVTGEQFSTPIQSGRIGKHKFRMKDIDTGTYSNVVTVTIG